MQKNRIVVLAVMVLCVGALALAEDQFEIQNWTAPPYWTVPAGQQVREHLTATGAAPENEGVSTESSVITSTTILPFTAITPCRLVDTRQSPDTPYLDNGGAGETRTYNFHTAVPYTGSGACSVLPLAAAYSLSFQFQVTDHQASLIAYPDNVAAPPVAVVVAYNTGLFYMNNSIVATGTDNGIKVFAQWGGNVVININGYYAPVSIVNSLNGLTGAVGVTGGSGILVGAIGNTVTITATVPQGPTGPTGASGINGATGATGATGSPGGLLDFADFFALMPPDNAATVAPGTDVSFPQDGPTSGTGLARTGPSTFNLADIGYYQVQFQVSVTEAGQLIVTANGADLAYTVAGRATGTNQIVGLCLVQTTVVNTVLTVRNPAGNSPALIITPLAGGTRPVSAHLVITRIQ